MIIKPAPGVKVRDPLSLQHIPETGIEVSDTDTYWARRLRSGDVVIASKPAPKPAAPAVKEK